MSTPEGSTEEDKDASTPETVLGPDQVREIDHDKRELYILIFRKRESYWEDWLKYTERYFELEQGPESSARTKRMEQCERNIDKIINAYKRRTTRKKKMFTEKWPYELVNNEFFPFLDGMDILVKAKTWEDCVALVEKHEEYRAENEKINPSTPACTPKEEATTRDIDAMSVSSWEGSASASESEDEL
jgi:hypothetical protein